MPKDITANTLSLLSQAEGLEPFIVVEFQWGGGYGSSFFGDAEVEGALGLINVESKIRNMPAIVSRVGARGLGTVSGLSLEVIDTDSFIRDRMKEVKVDDITVVVYFWEKSLSSAADATVLYKGRVSSPIVWEDTTGLFKCDVVSFHKSNETNWSPTVDDLPGLDEDADGKPWPLCFGTPRDVPAPLVFRGPRTTLEEDLESDSTSFKVDDADQFSSGEITLRVDGELIKGSFSGDTFSVTKRNAKYFTALFTKARPTGHKDEFNPFVLWLDDNVDDTDVVGKYFIAGASQVPGNGTQNLVNFCVAKKGKRLIFEKPWTQLNGDFWFVGSGKEFDVRRFAYQWLSDSIGSNADAWVIKAGATVTEYGNEADWYVANDMASTSLHRVAAFRTLQTNATGVEKRQLVSLDPSLYTKDLSDTTSVPGRTVTWIRVPISLDVREQGWEADELYVSLTSSVGENTSDAIKWILENRTTLEIDSDEFGKVRAAIENYPSHCAVWSGRDAIDVASDMAWQARCALVLSNGKARLRYLSSDDPATLDVDPTFLIGDALIHRDSLAISETQSDDVKTELNGEWKKRYAEEKWRPIRRTNNVGTYGLRRESRRFWIYQSKALVEKSMDFWIARMSRQWRTVNVTAPLDALPSEVWDTEDVFFPEDLGIATAVKGWIQEVRHSTKPHSFDLNVVLPVEIGTTVVSPHFYASDVGDTKPADPATKIKPGATEVAKVTPLPFSIISEPAMTVVPAEIIGIHSSTEFSVRLYPNSFANPPGGEGFLRILNPNPPYNLGDRSVVWRTPAGWFVSDVFA